METKLERISQLAKENSEMVFTSIGHLINKELLKECHEKMDKSKAVGIDEISKDKYEENLEEQAKQAFNLPFNQVNEEVETILQEYKKSITKEKKQEIVNKTFKIACDNINGSEVDFIGNRKCDYCESEEVENLLVEPEQIVNVDIPEISHNNWSMLCEKERKQAIISFFEENKILL